MSSFKDKATQVKAAAIPNGRVKHKSSGDREDEGRGVTANRYTQPYGVRVAIVGTADLLFHRYDVEDVEAQANSPKGSKERKTDNVEAYLYRLPNGNIGIPGMNMKSCIRDAAKFFSDPRSKRKSAFDLMRSAIRVTGGDLKKKKFDYLDKRRVRVNMAAISRARPALLEGWKTEFIIEVIDPAYVTPEWLNEIVQRAGRSTGLCDFRPDFGTFRVAKFEVIELKD